MDLSKEIELLFERYLQNDCTEDEIKFLSNYFDADENETTIKNLILAEIKSPETIDPDSATPETKRKVKKIFKKIINEIRKSK